jgi:hypothetical protein
VDAFTDVTAFALLSRGLPRIIVESRHSHVKRHHGTGRDRASTLDWKYCPDQSATRRLPPAVFDVIASAALTWDFWTMRRVA